VEGTDTTAINVYSHDELGTRTPADSILTSLVDTSCDEAGLDGLILQNIPGLFVTNANVASYILKKGVHTITYQFNGGTQQAKLDGGAYVTLENVSGPSTLSNKDDTQRVTVYTRASTLPQEADAITQEIIVDTEGDTLPNTWLQRIWVYELLKRLYAKIGIDSFQFDSMTIDTYDGRNITSYFEIPPGTSFYQKPECLVYDATHTCCYIGVGDKVYKRDMATHVYTELLQVTGYVVSRLWNDLIAADDLLVGIAISSTTYATKIILIDLRGEEPAASYALTARGTASDYLTGRANFALAATSGVSGRVFYCVTSGTDTIRYFDIDDLAEGDTGMTAIGTSLPNTAAWSTGNDYLFQADDGAGKAYLSKVTGDVGTWDIDTMLSTAAIDIIEDGQYDPTYGLFYFSKQEGTLKGLFYYDHAGDSISSINAVYRYGNFYWDGTVVRLNRFIDSAYDSTYEIACCWINGAGPGLTVETGTVEPQFFGDRIIISRRMAYDTDEDRYLFLFDSSFVLGQFYEKSSMFTDKEVKMAGRSVNDVIRDIALAFNLMVFVSTIKKAYAYRRSDGAGALVTSGNTVTIDNDDVAEIEKALDDLPAYDVVQVTSGDETWNYDGSTMAEGEYVAFAGEKILSLSNDFIPSAIVKDVAYFCYQYFKTARSRYLVTLANVLLLQYEPFDGMTLSLTGNKILESGTGIIVATTIEEDGNPTFEVLK
jgi:hypothetical protein